MVFSDPTLLTPDEGRENLYLSRIIEYTTYTGNVSSRFFVIYQYFKAGYDYVRVLTAIVYFYVSIQSS